MGNQHHISLDLLELCAGMARQEHHNSANWCEAQGGDRCRQKLRQIYREHGRDLSSQRSGAVEDEGRSVMELQPLRSDWCPWLGWDRLEVVIFPISRNKSNNITRVTET